MMHFYSLAARAARPALLGTFLALLAWLLPGTAGAQAITGFTPVSGPVGTSVTLTGTGFNATAAQNVVFFGATQAAVTAASPTSLTVTVPPGTTYQYPTVTNLATALTAYAAQPFVVTLNGTVAFAAKADFATGTDPYSVAIGDVNGDGKPDLVVANAGSNTVSVLRNTSTAGTVSFAARVNFATGTNPLSVAIGDVDGDGKPDLAVANVGSNTVSVLRNTSTAGTVSFAARVNFATGANPRSVAIGDVNGDGQPDLATANFFSNTVSVLRNTGAAGTVSFAAKADFATGGSPYSVAMGDVTGDGQPDLAVANSNSNTVSVLRNTGAAGTVSFAASADFATGDSPRSVAIGDVTGDGKPDLATANFFSNTVSVLRNTGSTGAVNFAARVNFATGTNPVSVAIGDVDGDGKPDLAVANSNSTSNTVSVLRNTVSAGTVSFAAKADVATGSLPLSVAIGDMDGDGNPDLATANDGSNTVSVLRQVPLAITGFTPASGPVGTSVTLTGTGFNATAAQNVVFFGATQAAVTAASPTSLTVTVPLGTTYQYPSVTNLATALTAYAAQPFVVTLNGAVAFAAKADVATGGSPYSVAIGDVDGDGKPDLAVANSFNNTVSVLRNTSTAGTVSFAAKADFTTGPNPFSVAIGDVDGDGKPDLAVANANFSGTVSVLLNTSTAGTVSFAPRADFATGSYPVRVAIGDVNGDGQPDLAVANSNTSGTVSVLRNTGAAGTLSFAAKADFATGNGPTSVAIGDVDGDGQPDLVVANSSNTVSVLRNTGAAGTVNFAAKADFATGNYPYSVVIGDVDGDGQPDLAVANYFSNTVSVLRNTAAAGTVSFAAKADFATGSRPTSVAIGDVDGDGQPDLATANYDNATVSVLRNTGAAGTVGFAAKADFVTGSYPRSVAIGDADGDGKPDLAVTNAGSSTLSVLRQVIPPPTITSFTPASGPVGTAVTLTGMGFNATAAQNVVFFGATQAAVTAASPTSLTVTVPLGTTYQYPSVTNLTTALTGYAAQPFVVTLNGTGAFAVKADAATGATPYSVAIGDVNGDGQPDLAVVNEGSNTVSVLRNTSTAGTVSFAAKADFATGTNPYSVAIGDVDGDGQPDLAVANANSNTVSVLRNTSTAGTVSFAAKADFATGDSPNLVAIGDVNGDGKPDLAVANANSNTVSVLRNTGAAGAVSFAASADFATGNGPFSVAMGDVTGDGQPDLATANYGSNTVSVLRNTSTAGAVSFAAKADFATGNGPSSVAIGDADGDSQPDLVVANYGSNTVSVLLNTSTAGAVSFAAKADFATGNSPYLAAIGDVDGDGKPDLAVANANSNTVSVLRNTGAAGAVGFAAKADVATGTGPVSVAIGDVDGDGKPDLAVANSSGNTVSVLRQLTPPPTITGFTPASGPVGTSVTFTGTGFNATAAQNVVFFGATQAAVTAASPTSLTVTVPPGTTYQYPSVSNLATALTAYAAQPFVVTLNGAGAFAVKADAATGATPYSVAIGDVDGDGKPDLAVANYGSNTVSVLRNTSTAGAVSFAVKADFATGNGPYSVAIGDVDGDGKPDLAVANYGSNTVSVLRNTGAAGTVGFAAKADFATGTNPYSVAIGDVNGDGQPDLAVANSTSSTVSVLRNTGAAGAVGFAAKADFATGNGPYSVAIGDVNGDGQPDLAVANYFSNTVSVLRNTAAAGTVGFAAKADFATGSRPTSVAIGDVNGDGQPDLAVANATSNTVSVLRNTGAAGAVGFAAKADFATGNSPDLVAIGDVNGDGQPDLAVANSASNTVSVLRNTGAAGAVGFAAKADVATGAGPFSMAIGDVDGDGQPDLATANATSSTVSVLRQVPPAPIITSFTPVSGPVGTRVTITGINLGSASNVRFNGTAQTVFTSNSATQLVLNVPAGATTGTLTVTTPGGTSAASSQTFTVVPPPTVTGVSPAAELPGTVVTLTGTGFTAGSTVSFGGTAAASVSVVSATTLTATVPASLAAGSAPVSVTTGDGTSATQPFSVLAVYDGGSVGACAAAVPATASLNDGAWHYLLSATGQVVAAYNYSGASLGNLAIELLRADAAQPVRRDPRNRAYLDRNWHLTASAGRFDGRSVQLRLYGLAAEQARLQAADPAATLAGLNATQYSGANEDCSLANNVASAEHRTLAAPASAPAGTGWFVAELTVADHFSEFYLTSSATPLPVELTAFTAQASGPRAVRLAWTTASEKNSQQFDVERSLNGTRFERLGTVAAAGSSTSPRSYGFNDNQVPRTLSPQVPLYYRLKQVDADGTFSYSPVRVVTLAGAAEGLALYPNPAHGGGATLTGAQPGTVVTVHDALGRLVASATADATGTAALARPAGLPVGVYVVRSGGKALRLTVE
ncbi:FG-GAP-like repeat-containing protein [Hymenobacter canadensis]|uniref:FG-GAP-like repeat-containing protein n=1 Tax=Hymenobacter canadensis TaxID=2999067 RepID=A0ABY7LYC1_9BACT|nr:FG-GAP-like repeat-containing protein [Hymenobacter canadensis]WBA44392.1 FG-GAP-like repeat-containing protein [Hymenobacter canadensis]